MCCFYFLNNFSVCKAALGDDNGHVWCTATNISHWVIRFQWKINYWNLEKYRQHFYVRVSPSDNIIQNLIARTERIVSIGDLPEGGPKHWRSGGGCTTECPCASINFYPSSLRSNRHRQNIASVNSETGFINVPVQDSNGPNFIPIDTHFF